MPLLVIIFGCSPSDEELPRQYIAAFTDKPIVIDGLMDETAWNKTEWSAEYADIEGFHMPKPLQSTQMKMLWDDQYLYIGVKLMENHLWATLTDRDAIIYNDNDFEVFLDPNGDAQDYYELEINAFGTEFDLLMDKPYKKGGRANIPWNFEGLKSAVKLEGSINDPTDLDSHWQLEIAIPYSSLDHNPGIQPAAGDEWRINFSRVQWDLDIVNETYQKRSSPEHNWVWSPQGKIDMHIPEKWGFVIFSDK